MNFQNIRYEINKERREKPNLKFLIYWAAISALGIVIIGLLLDPSTIHFRKHSIFYKVRYRIFLLVQCFLY